MQHSGCHSHRPFLLYRVHRWFLTPVLAMIVASLDVDRLRAARRAGSLGPASGDAFWTYLSYWRPPQREQACAKGEERRGANRAHRPHSYASIGAKGSNTFNGAGSIARAGKGGRWWREAADSTVASPASPPQPSAQQSRRSHDASPPTNQPAGQSGAVGTAAVVGSDHERAAPERLEVPVPGPGSAARAHDNGYKRDHSRHRGRRRRQGRKQAKKGTRSSAPVRVARSQSAPPTKRNSAAEAAAARQAASRRATALTKHKKRQQQRQKPKQKKRRRRRRSTKRDRSAGAATDRSGASETRLGRRREGSGGECAPSPSAELRSLRERRARLRLACPPEGFAGYAWGSHPPHAWGNLCL